MVGCAPQWCGVLRPGGTPGCESRSRGGKGRRNGGRLQRALCCSHPLHRACALTWLPGAHGPRCEQVPPRGASALALHPAWPPAVPATRRCPCHAAHLGFGKPVALPQLWACQSRRSPGTCSRLSPGENAALQGTALQGEEILQQEIPSEKGGVLPGCRVLEMEASASPPGARGGRCLCARAHAVLPKGRCFSCQGWMLSRSSLES